MGIGARRRVRRVGGQLIRRFGLLPAGIPDGLGDDDALRGTRLDADVLVFFADTPTNLYQLRQWLAPLAELARRRPVTIVCTDSRTAAALRRETALPVLCIGRTATLEEMVERSDVALALYVNHNMRNLQCLRFASMLHAYLGHGESDKIASASNQVKAYDFVLLAGETARDRLIRALFRFDAATHVRLIGRPQFDHGPGATPSTDAGAQPPSVLYAPTWEGAQPSMAYGSVHSHGLAVVKALLDSNEFRLQYRPHPRSGANSASYAKADQEIRALIARHPDRARIDLSPGWQPRQDPAELLICDVSAVAADWLTTGKPVLVTVPTSPHAALDSDSILTAVPTLPVDALGDVVATVRRLLVEPAPAATPAGRAWLVRTLGDLTPGSATERFHAVVEELIALRADGLAARAERGMVR